MYMFSLVVISVIMEGYLWINVKLLDLQDNVWVLRTVKLLLEVLLDIDH